MLDDVAISVQNLTKIYKLYNSPKDRLKESLHPLRKKYHKDFYALNDVSFNIKKGETVGIVGRNGSGKSTLLKTITGVLTPSSGTVTVDGKISALLELGAGFNPQLTGIENVYFNGTIMGYTREEIDGKLDEILSFADIGEFVYQPVKTYSSGMFIRLAFAVAVNVDPEILIIDEAMAVGDARFSKKCYDRFRLFKESGKTILLVTHSAEAVKTHADQALFLDEGKLVYQGEPKEAVKLYLRMLFPVQHKVDFSADQTAAAAAAAQKTEQPQEKLYCLEFNDFGDDPKHASPVAQFVWARVVGIQPPNIFHGGEKIAITLKARWDGDRIRDLLLEHELTSNIIIGIRMQSKNGVIVFATNTFLLQNIIDPLQSEECVMDLEITMPQFCQDDYFITPVMSLGTQVRHVGLVTNENLIHLNCIPHRKVFGIVDSDLKLEITQAGDKSTIPSNIGAQ